MTSLSMNLPGTSLAQKVNAALQESFPVAEYSLRASAISAGWPESAANEITLNGSSVSISDSAADWEFGTLDTPPTPVVRSSGVADQANNALLEDLVNRLKKVGVL